VKNTLFVQNHTEKMYVNKVSVMFCVKVPKSDEEYDLRVPRDMAYIFSGAYVPLSCKLIEQVSPSAGLIHATGSDFT